MLPDFTRNDLNVLSHAIALDTSLFISPDISFSDSYHYLSHINEHLQQYFTAFEENYLFCHRETHILPHLELPDLFYLFLFFASNKNIESAKKTCGLLNVNDTSTLFYERQKQSLDNDNPYYEHIYQVFTASNDFLNGNISHNDFMVIIENNKLLLFPNLYELPITENKESSDLINHMFMSYLQQDCIVYLKEKIYLNLLFHFIEKPESYENSPYVFMDFLDKFSFNSVSPFSHLKPIFLRFEDKHWHVLKTFKQHSLYHLFLETLFIASPNFAPYCDESYDQYNYYFDFELFSVLLRKHVPLDDLFVCSASDNKNMRDFLFSIVMHNNYEPDNQRFNNLMIIYEKNKIEDKLKPKNTPFIVQKI